MGYSELDTVVLVCRDCCCGTARKHPDVDHDFQLERIEEAAAVAGAKVIVTRCLDVCSRSNVVVVRTLTAAQRKTLWFGEVLSRKRLEALCAWLRAGAFASGGPLPATLAFATFAPTDASVRCAMREER